MKQTRPPFKKAKKDFYQELIKISDFVYQMGDSEILRQPSKPIAIKDIRSGIFREKLGYLKKCFLKYRRIAGLGRGMAAVQVGIPERFAVVYLKEKAKILTIINPKITKASKKLLKYPEICMSSNPIVAKVARPAWVEFTYYDELGKKQFWNQKDNTKEGRMYNRVFQHEIDHLDGILNIDRVESKELVFEFDPKFYEKAKFEEIKSKTT